MRETPTTYFDRNLGNATKGCLTVVAKALPRAAGFVTASSIVDNLATNAENIAYGLVDRGEKFWESITQAFPNGWVDASALFAGMFIGQAAKNAKTDLKLEPNNPISKAVWGLAIEAQPASFLYGVTRAVASLDQIMALATKNWDLSGMALTALGASIALLDNLFINTDPKKEWKELLIGGVAFSLAVTGLLISSPETRHLTAPLVVTAGANVIENLIEATKNL